MEDCRFGIDRVKAGPPKLIQDNKANVLVKLTATFYQMQDLILERGNNPKVSDFNSIFDQLGDLLAQAQSSLKPYNSYLKEIKDL